MADLERPLAAADEQLRVWRDRALVHAEEPDRADEGIDDDLEHVRERVRLRARHRVELLGVRALALEKGRRVALRGVGREAGEDVEQRGDARAVLRRGEAHRDEVPLAQRALEGRVQLLRADLALL